MGEIVTFYSYKGGVGRTMALANVAVLLSQWKYRVLIVDWDLEAPGLEFFFQEFLDLEVVTQKEGIIDLLGAAFTPLQSKLMKWQDLLIQIRAPTNQETLHFMTAGKRDDNYFARVRSLDLQAFYAEKDGGQFIESLRSEWKETYDFVLVDSRTGITDIGGICTIHLPDILVLFCTATDQSLRGITDVAGKAQRARQDLPFDRFSLLSIPILCRFDAKEEFKISQEWVDRFAEECSKLYASWLPNAIKKHDFVQITKIPYISYFSFGEKLPVLEQGTVDPGGLGYAYETLAALISRKLESVEQLIENRSDFVGLAKGHSLFSIQRLGNKSETLMKLEMPKGTVPLNSHFYVRRQADEALEQQLDKPGTITTIRGARQTGKTSLLIRGVDYAQCRGDLAIALDFQQAFDSSQLTSLDSFLRHFAYEIASRSQIEYSDVDNIWNSPLSPLRKVTHFIEDSVLRNTDRRIVLAIDEADTLLNTSFYSEFFGLLRTWHNSRATSDMWSRISIIIVVSTNPTLLIDNIHQSPFNVGEHIDLEDFSQDQVQDLNLRHGNPLNTTEISEGMKLLGGHPYLTRQMLYTLVKEDMAWSELLAIADREDGPFGMHLCYYWSLLQRDPELMKAIRQVIDRQVRPDEKALLRLSSAGLLQQKGQQYICRCGLYERFFRSQL